MLMIVFYMEILLGYLILQSDLDTISLWSVKCLIGLNFNKCSVLSITLKRNSCFHDNNILGTTLMRATSNDYLCVTISSDLSWLKHVKKIETRLAEHLVYL